MALFNLEKLLSENSYPGRGIVIGKSADGKNAMIAYFIMGRSVNSRNRIFERFDGGMRTKAFDESKLTDPHLIIYNPYLSAQGGSIDIITNGDQTNTIYDYINETSDRVPIADWYYTSTARQQMFQNRTVLGGLYIALL